MHSWCTLPTLVLLATLQVFWVGYKKPTFEPATSLVVGPDTYQWTSKADWAAFCADGPKALTPKLFTGELAGTLPQPGSATGKRTQPASGAQTRSAKRSKGGGAQRSAARNRHAGGSQVSFIFPDVG